MAAADLTAARLRELLRYDPETGLFIRRVSVTSAGRAGAIAGSVYRNGYRVIAIEKKDYAAHRLAWFYVHGEWPPAGAHVDHINGVKDDNRIENLRIASASMNSQNQRQPHADKVSCKLIGATWDKMYGNWKAQLTYKKKTIYLGRFKTAEEAHQAYIDGKRRIHEGCTL